MHTIKGRGISVYTTRGKWTYTKTSGAGALGDPENLKLGKPEEETPYMKVGSHKLSNITQGIDIKKGELTVLEGLKKAHDDANATK
jgi:hypothetical protein